MDNIKEFVFEKISKEDCCIVIGSNDMINDFSSTFGVRIDVLMGDFRKKDKTKSEPIRVFNGDTKEILMFGLAKKKDMKNVITGMKMHGATKEDIENITAIMLKKGHHIFTHQTKSDEEKAELIDKIFKIPDKKMIDEMKEVMDNIKKRYDDELYKGYA